MTTNRSGRKVWNLGNITWVISSDILSRNVFRPIVHEEKYSMDHNFRHSHYLSARYCIGTVIKILSWSLMGVKGLRYILSNKTPRGLPHLNFIEKSTSQPTSTLSSISSVSWWTGSTFISTGISWCRKINTLNSRVTRLTIHFAGVNVTVTEPSCVSSLTCAAHVYKLVISVGCVAFFWFHALTTMLAGAHSNGWTPTDACTFIVSSNEGHVKLQRKKNFVCGFCPFVDLPGLLF